MPTSKVRITKTLLDSWLWSFKRDDGWEDFLSTLNRERKPPTKAMLDGTRFENCLNNVLNGEKIPQDHEWYKPISEMSIDLFRTQQQVVLFQECVVDDQPFLLHGVLDYLRAGRIWDCKFTKKYHLNKYHWRLELRWSSGRYWKMGRTEVVVINRTAGSLGNRPAGMQLYA